jgi:hypothetical protein
MVKKLDSARIGGLTTATLQFSFGRFRGEGGLFSIFHYFLLVFERSKNWMAPNMRSWKHLSMSFSASHF